MNEAVIGQGIGKTYRLGEQGTAYTLLRERIFETAKAVFRKRDAAPSREPFWALKDVSFSIGHAEVVGLVGKNGAGKSTLLKILSRITEPTEGRIDLYGRVSSLLEVGIGFHPELSGRDNIFLNGAILGMSRNEIRRKFDEIVEFAEIAKFLDTPVKRYSSGMYVRLAFAVAAHLEPDILIVDEVLAVGDSAFQQKCLGKMRDIRAEGRTVIVVSHNMATVSSLCQKVIWLANGQVKAAGDAQDIIRKYLSEGVENDFVWTPRHGILSAFEYRSVSVASADPASSEGFPANAAIDVFFDINIHDKFPASRIEMHLLNDNGEVLLTSTSADDTGQMNHEWALGPQRFRCRIPPNLLMPGRYFVTITEPYGGHYIPRENVLTFTVTEEGSVAARDQRQGKIAPLLQWTKNKA
ncbi:MAG: ATP-binding cassette domain-containing protein [Acidobacteria bacterium]|nr:ATP-binding cassette domain-containing protein [Acidobacteriota bacterium]MBV9071304.1 ATP-binding cassette domain-containing protein [Acidobacteriota bacterium]MBV9188142.1 ATP-binding cassette domain-containing protein [Acidobacteriota bacterium]